MELVTQLVYVCVYMFVWRLDSSIRLQDSMTNKGNFVSITQCEAQPEFHFFVDLPCTLYLPAHCHWERILFKLMSVVITKRRLNSGNACYHSVQTLLSSLLLSKNLKIRIYKTIIFLWFCIGAKLGL
jgi:hypothetical protein